MMRFDWKQWLSLGRPMASLSGRPARPPRKNRFRPLVTTLEDRITPAPTLLSSFGGIDFDANAANNTGTLVAQADPSGAVGPAHVVSAVHGSIEIHKLDGTNFSSESLRSFFSSLPLNSGSDIYNPKVVYDTLSGLFLVSAFEKRDLGVNNAGNVSNILLAVSQSPDPTAGWYFLRQDARQNIAPTNNSFFIDSAGLGVSATALYVTGNMMQFGAPNTFGGARVWIFPKVGFYDGTGTATGQRFDPFQQAGVSPGLTPTAANVPQPAQMNPSAPLTAPLFTGSGGGASNGNLAAGTYFVRYTFIRATGESPPSPISTPNVSVSAGWIPQVTLPPRPVGVTGFNLYLSNTAAGSGTEQRYNVAAIPGSTTAPSTFDLATAAPSLGSPPSANSAFGTFLVSAGWVGPAPSTTLDRLSVIQITNPLAPSPTFSNQFIPLGDIHSGAALPSASQAGTSNTIFTGTDTRITSAVWRNNRLYAANTIVPIAGSGPDAGQATVHWYNIDTTALGALTLVDQGDVGGEELGVGTQTFFPSIAADGANNLAISFSASNGNTFVGAFYTGRTNGAAAGSTQPMGALFLGHDFYRRSVVAGRSPWGQSSGVFSDPSGSNFWAFNQYAMARGTLASGEDGRWATQWGNFDFNLSPANVAPVVTMSAGSGTYVENSLPVVLDPGVTLVDNDSPNFDGATLLVSFVSGATVNDQLGLQNQASMSGGITLSGNQIFFGGNFIGTFTGGANGLPLVIDLNNLSDGGAMQAILRAVTFANNSDNPTTAPRTVQFLLTDGDGGISNLATISANVTAVNDPPVVGLPAPATVQQGNSVAISGISVSDIDVGTTNLVTVQLNVQHGTLNVSTSVSGGIGAGDITSGANGSAFIEITATLSKINTTLLNANGLTYTPFPSYNGPDTLSVKANDNGFTGIPGFLTDTENLPITVLGNHAPQLVPANYTTNLPAIPEDIVAPPGTASSPPGASVIFLIAPAFQDQDQGAKKGIAVVGLTGTANGVWQFALSGNSAWTALANISTTHALLLRDVDKIRFVPNPDFNGSESFSFRAWDQIVGIAGTYVSTAVNGGDTSISVEIGTATQVVTPVNDAPVVNANFTPTLTTIPRNASSPAGDFAGNLVGGATDIDGNSLGIALTGYSGPGLWQYQINGAQQGWKNLVGLGVSVQKALMLRPIDLVRFVPDIDYLGPASINFQAWDQTTGAFGSTVNLSTPGATGGTTAFSTAAETATITVAKPLKTIKEGVARPSGNVVSKLIGPVLPAQGPVKGIAIIGTTVTDLSGTGDGGKWQFSINGGLSWKDVGPVSDTLARLLRSNDLLRFKPNGNFNGSATISYRSWDRSVGSKGGQFDTTQNTAAFSSLTDVSIITIKPVNDRPTLNTSLTPTFTPIQASNTNPSGNLVSSLLAGFGDVDGPRQGIAVVGKFGPGSGLWQYNVNDGTGWHNIPAVSPLKAFLLRDTDLIRFVPETFFSGGYPQQASLLFRAWDQLTGFATQRTALTGSAFGKATETATLLINP